MQATQGLTTSATSGASGFQLGGYYLYVGSALGHRGLLARIGHHRQRAVRPHWHIDYPRRHARLDAAHYACGARCEHEWAG